MTAAFEPSTDALENSTEFEENFNLADVPSAKFRFDDPADNLQRPTVFIMYSG